MNEDLVHRCRSIHNLQCDVHYVFLTIHLVLLMFILPANVWLYITD